MYKHDLVLNNLQRLICYKTQPTKQPLKSIDAIYVDIESCSW